MQFRKTKGKCVLSRTTLMEQGDTCAVFWHTEM